MFPLKILNSSFIVFIKAPLSLQFCFHSSVVKHNKNCQQSQADRQDLQSTSLLLPWELQSHPGAEPCFHWDLSRRLCFPVCAILCWTSELLWRNAHIRTETVLCLSDCTYQIQSPLYTEVQIIVLFKTNNSTRTASSSGHHFFVQESYKCHTKSVFLMKLTAKSMQLLATGTNLQTSLSETAVWWLLFKICFAAISRLSDFWLLLKKCLTSDKGDHNTQSFAQQGSSKVNHRLLVCQLSGAWKSSQRAFPFPWPSGGSCAKTLTFSFSILNPSSLLCLPLPFPTWLQAPRSPRIWCLLTAAQVTDLASLFQQKMQVKRIKCSFPLHPCLVQHCRYSKGKTSSETPMTFAREVSGRGVIKQRCNDAAS